VNGVVVEVITGSFFFVPPQVAAFKLEIMLGSLLDTMT
jgi:hypothetical protein